MPQRHLVHEARVVAPGQPFRFGRHRAEHVGEVVDLVLGVVAQDMAGDPLLVAGVADAQAHAAEIRPQVLVERAQPVVPGGAAALLDLDLERREVELVVEHGQRVHAELVEAQRLADRAAAFVHESRGLEQQDLLAANPAFLQPAEELLLDRAEAMDIGDGVRRHEAGVVPLHGVQGTGIAEADPELHGKTPLSRRRQGRQPPLPLAGGAGGGDVIEPRPTGPPLTPPASGRGIGGKPPPEGGA